MVGPVFNGRTRLDSDPAIAELAKAQKGQVFTPKRIAVAGTAIAAIVLLFLLKVAIFGTAASPYAHLKGKVESSIKEALAAYEKIQG